MIRPFTAGSQSTPFRRPLLMLAATLIAALSAGAAFACSCVGYRTAAEQFAKVEIAFIGTVESEERQAGPYEDAVRTRFAVTRTLKGQPLPVRTVEHASDNGGNCGIDFKVGQTVLVFAYTSKAGLSTSSCSAPQFPLAEFERLVEAK